MTGYYRDGFCRTGGGDFGAHVVCAQVGDCTARLVTAGTGSSSQRAP